MKLELFSIIFLLTVFSACSDKGKEEDTSKDEVVPVLKEPQKFMQDGVVSSYDAIHGQHGTYYLLLSDQLTTTNTRMQVFWDKLSIDNASDFVGKDAIEKPWIKLNKANTTANLLLKNIALGRKIMVDGEDKTAEMEAMAYVLKGYSQGFLGIVFDHAHIVDVDTDVLNLEYQPYYTMIDTGIANLDKAASIIQKLDTDEYNYLPGVTFDKETFLEYINAHAARILISKARSNQENSDLGASHWSKVLDYANKGFKEDFYIPTTPDVLYSLMIDDATFKYINGQGYYNVDIKIPFIADKTNTYPTTPGRDQYFDPVVTDDKRIEEYFDYVMPFGTFNPKPKGWFVHYSNKRFSNDNNHNKEGVLNPTFMKAEIDLLRAEALVNLGRSQEAVDVLNNSRRSTVGELPPVQISDDLLDVIHYEYAIEINLSGGMTSPWAYMRRNDLLTQGTPTQMPLPASELEAIGQEVYTFGGIENAGSLGKYGEVTASNVNGWAK